MSHESIADVPCACACASEEQPSEAELMARLEDLIDEYHAKKGGLIPVLQVAQTIFGYLPDTVINRIAEGFNKTVSEVASVVSFYSFFTRHPRGKYLVRAGLTAFFIVIGVRTIGTLLISALVVFPSVISSQLTKSFKGTLTIGIVSSLIIVVIGIFIAHPLETPVGSTIVLLYAILLLFILLIKQIKRRTTS